nr:fasciclin-1 isoform X2 [Leptinotarsa decemlineata]
MGNWPVSWCFLLGLLSFGVFDRVRSERLEDKMKSDPDISQFQYLVESSRLANLTLSYKQVTVFAPTNAAFQEFEQINKEDSESMVLYHMTNVPKTTDQLGSSYTSLYSELSGNPPLWITHVSGTYHDDIYVNNARILVSQSNIQGNENNLLQVLHKIDEVLVPTRSPDSATNRIYNPTAWEFLENYESLIPQTQNPYRVRNFRQKVQQNAKQDIYKVEGGHTFFIPIDEGFGNDRAALIDEKIIDGHVIPKQVLFTTPTKKDVGYQTLANSDNDLRVVIMFTQEQRERTVINYVKSHTLFGDGKHAQGVVIAEIVKPNIPVKNGVVHLIQKPLMVVDSTVKKLLEQYKEQDGKILSNFFSAIKDAGPGGEDFLKTLERSHDITLFAPCNKALEGDLVLNSILSDNKRFLEILKLHLVVDDRLYVDKIAKESHNKVFQAQTLSKGKKLYFNVLTSGPNRTMSVEGGGVNATVIQADLAATNGIIHVIDRVLGVPYSTVLDKLRNDPMLKATYTLGNLQGFNNQLVNTTKKFTYFVPRDKAWFDAKVTLPTAIKTLFMKEYAYHATATLERHLVISDEPYTMERIKRMTNESNTFGTFGQRKEVELPTMRGSLKLFVEERQDNTFIINWKGEKIPVFRPNVECTNGIIHVIDAPFLKEGDIQVSKASITAIGPQLVMILVAKFLLL